MLYIKTSFDIKKGIAVAIILIPIIPNPSPIENGRRGSLKKTPTLSATLLYRINVDSGYPERRFFLMIYFPIQKLEKILPNKSSALNSPVISPKI